MPLERAKEIAYDKGLDLVLIAPNSDPPVCRIMDYGKYRYERDKKEKESKRKQQTVEIKEVQLSFKIDTHDFETKARRAIGFLSDGNKVRVVLRFRGREMVHQQIGRDLYCGLRNTAANTAQPIKARYSRGVSLLYSSVLIAHSAIRMQRA